MNEEGDEQMGGCRCGREGLWVCLWACGAGVDRPVTEKWPARDYRDGGAAGWAEPSPLRPLCLLLASFSHWFLALVSFSLW